jgi:hypothetical protein
MTLEERANLILAFARVLCVNGQATDQTVAAAERLAGILGLQTELMPRWGELQLRVEDSSARVISQVAVRRRLCALSLPTRPAFSVSTKRKEKALKRG